MDEFQQQSLELERVNTRIAGEVVRFLRARLQTGRAQFHMDDLRRAIAGELTIAPASPDRVLRDLRQRGAVDYRVVSRRGSLYEVTQVARWE